MVTDIKVKVEDKVASVLGAPAIICGNSDYTVTFTFDEEWETLEVKTARFLYKRGDAYQYIDVVFTGATAAVPILSNIEEVYLGVYAGELHTTTPTRIICKKSILCEASEPHDEPAADIYQQLLETINNLELLPTVSKADAGKALMVREDGHWVVRCPDFMHNQKDGELIRFFFGTQEEWEAWTGNKNGVLFVPTDDTTLEEILAAAEAATTSAQLAHTAVLSLAGNLKNGLVVPAKADYASSAGSASAINGTAHLYKYTIYMYAEGDVYADVYFEVISKNQITDKQGIISAINDIPCSGVVVDKFNGRWGYATHIEKGTVNGSVIINGNLINDQGQTMPIGIEFLFGDVTTTTKASTTLF